MTRRPFQGKIIPCLLLGIQTAEAFKIRQICQEKFVSDMRKNRCCLSVALLLLAGFKSRGLVYFESITKFQRILEGFSHLHLMQLFCVDAKIFSKKFELLFSLWKHEKTELMIHIHSFFSLTALSYPYVKKMSFLIGNWTKAPFVLFTL